MGGEELFTVTFEAKTSAKIRKWKVKEETFVPAGKIIFVYDVATGDPGKRVELSFKCKKAGVVRRLLAKVGDVIEPGGDLLQLGECPHPTVMKELCAECGKDLSQDEQSLTNASVPMIHSIPELRISEEQAQIFGKEDEKRLIKDRKLVLLVDLDQTLIHTTSDEVQTNLKDVYHFKLYGPDSPWYHTKLRPKTNVFLEEISKYYELHICTFGNRMYAHSVAKILDPDGKLFSDRILSRDECFDQNSKKANLKALFPCGDNMVCIIDDRGDVWNYAPNLIHVKQYRFFKHTGDIHAPFGLGTKENDKDDFTKETSGKKAKVKLEIPSESTTEKDTDDETESNKEAELEIVETTHDAIKDENEILINDEPAEDGEDSDDYLMYLEDILKTIHKAYYEAYDSMDGEEKSVPDLKVIIGNVKQKVLKGCKLVFSGLVPSHAPLDQSKAYKVAISLGAKVLRDLSAKATHLIAAKPGTVKVNLSKKIRDIRIVTPRWLWDCAERWERLDERLYPLRREVAKDRIPPAHCVSLEPKATTVSTAQFINPLLTLSSKDMTMMKQEVIDLMSTDDDEDDDDYDDESGEDGEMESDNERFRKFIQARSAKTSDDDSSSSSHSLSGVTIPKGWSEEKVKARKRKSGEATTCSESDLEEEFPSVKFRRGESLPSDVDLGDEGESQDSPESDDPDAKEWERMGAELEKQFVHFEYLE